MALLIKSTYIEYEVDKILEQHVESKIYFKDGIAVTFQAKYAQKLSTIIQKLWTSCKPPLSSKLKPKEPSTIRLQPYLCR